MNCPCSSGQSYDRCCGRFISQAAEPENAEQLMRSRYSAFVFGEIEYLLNSWHADFRPADLNLDKEVRWLGLEVLHFDENAQRATVEFEARLLLHDKIDGLHEKSRFVCEQGRWLYTDGDLLPPDFTPWKPGRNEPCPCGSGKKFKRCCARNG